LPAWAGSAYKPFFDIAAPRSHGCKSLFDLDW
jgi:hypothetical protein